MGRGRGEEEESEKERDWRRGEETERARDRGGMRQGNGRGGRCVRYTDTAESERAPIGQLFNGGHLVRDVPVLQDRLVSGSAGGLWALDHEQI